MLRGSLWCARAGLLVTAGEGEPGVRFAGDQNRANFELEDQISKFANFEFQNLHQFKICISAELATKSFSLVFQNACPS